MTYTVRYGFSLVATVEEENVRGVYRATCAVEELGIEPGDTVIVDPGHERAPLRIVRSYTKDEIPAILNRIHDFPCLRIDDGPQPQSHQVSTPHQRRWMRLIS